MNPGPCVYCGDRNFASSAGGPHICPRCDSGDIFRRADDGLRVEMDEQAAEITRLRAELEAVRKAAREHVAAWRVYFHETGRKPDELWPTFATLAALAQPGARQGEQRLQAPAMTFDPRHAVAVFAPSLADDVDEGERG